MRVCFRRVARRASSTAAIVTLALLSATAACRVDERNSTLVVGTNVWPGYEPLYLARSLGYYDEARIRLVEYSSATQVIRAFRNGAIQVAALTLDEALTLKQHEVPLRVILITDFSLGADAVLGQPGVAGLGDLRGRRIGVESSAVGAYVLTRALQQAGLSRSELTIVPVDVNEHERAFTSARVEAIVTFEPVRSRLLAAGAVELFNSKSIPGEIVDVLVVRADLDTQKAASIDLLLRGWFDSLRYIRDRPDDAARRIKPRLKLSEDEVLQAFANLHLADQATNLEHLTGAAPLLQTATELADVMRASNLLSEVPQLADLIDDRPLRRASAGRVE